MAVPAFALLATPPAWREQRDKNLPEDFHAAHRNRWSHRALPGDQPGLVAEQSAIHRVPGNQQGRALQARFRSRAPRGDSGDAPHRELPQSSRLHRTVAARVPDAVHEYALREQRSAGGFREAAARREKRRRFPAPAARDYQGPPVRPQRRRAADVVLPGSRGERIVLLQGSKQAHRMRRRSDRPGPRRRHRVRRRPSGKRHQHAAQPQRGGGRREQSSRREADCRARHVRSGKRVQSAMDLRTTRPNSRRATSRPRPIA